MTRCRYTMGVHYRVGVDGVRAVISLVDEGGVRSITHDAEQVVDDLVRGGFDLRLCRVIYRDTLGHWDELLVRDGKFAGFRSLGGATELLDALARMWGRWAS